MHRQLLKMLFAYQLEGFLWLSGGLQEAWAKRISLC